MSRYLQCMIAGTLCLLLFSNIQAFSYPIYEPVVSTAYTAAVPAQNDQALDKTLSIIDVAKTPSLLLLQTDQAKDFSIVLHNNHFLPVHNMTIHYLGNAGVSTQSNTCVESALLPTQSCQIKLQYQSRIFNGSQPNRIILPFTIQYDYYGQPISEQVKIVVIEMPYNQFYKAPIQQYPNVQGIGSDYIKSLYLSKSGQLFVGSDGGLSEGLEHNHYFKNLTSLNGLGSNNITAVLKDPAGTIFVGTDGSGLAMSNDGGLTFSQKTVRDGLAGNHIRSLYWKNHILYIGTNHGLSISHDQGQTFSNRGLNTGLNSLMINQIIGDKQGHLFIATDNGLAESDDEAEHFTMMTVENGLGDNAINAIAIAGNDDLYVATEDGLSESDNYGETFTTYTTHNGLLSDRILSLAINPTNHILYVGTECGLNIKYPHTNNFKTTTKKSCKQNGPINAIQVNPNKSIVYLALGGDGLGVVSAADYSINHIKTNMIADNLLAGLWVDDRQVDVATASGLSESLDGGATYKTWVAPNKNTNVLSFYEGLNGKSYIGTDQGLYIENQGQIQAHLLTNYQINSMMKDEKTGLLIVGTDQGIFVSTDENTFVQHTVDDGLGSDDINSVAYDPIQHIIYVATQHGISYSLDGGQSFKNILLPHDQVSHCMNVLVTPLGAVYVGTDHGLYKAIWINKHLQWQMIPVMPHGNPAITSLNYSPAHDMLFVGVNGGVYLSEDGAESFKGLIHGLEDKTVVGANLLADGHTLLVATRQHGLWMQNYSH